MTNRAQKRHSDRTWRKPDLRTGYTTSACAAACAVAAIYTLVSGNVIECITIDLPVKPGVNFSLERCQFEGDGVLCGVIKDSGDDPDVTHGAEIQAYVRWQEQTGITITGGLGVGLATRPGLPVAVGEAAINPGPRRLIRHVLQNKYAQLLAERGILVEIRVPQGEQLARGTMNKRLGIEGGISILGTSGILKPFSNAAYRASIHTELSVAHANGASPVVLTTGSRSEQYAMRHYPHLPPLAFIQVGDHMDYALRQSSRIGIESLVISGMIGKISKLAQGRLQTHVSQGEVDFDFLAAVARQLGAPEDLVARIRQANTARHVQTMLQKENLEGLEDALASMAARACFDFAAAAQKVEVLLFSIKGNLLAAAHMERKP